MTKAQTLLDNEMWKDTPPVKVLAMHAKEFAEWCSKDWALDLTSNKWWNVNYNSRNKITKPTSELYQIFNENK
jgi:hypothetical protein